VLGGRVGCEHAVRVPDEVQMFTLHGRPPS
jgi:hypothetical protein